MTSTTLSSSRLTTQQYLERRKILEEEIHNNKNRPYILQQFQHNYGSDVVLNEAEIRVNDQLMLLKSKEYERLTNLGIHFSSPFKAIKTSLHASPVMDLLKKMPKGSLLHAHTSLLGSVEWMVKELTYWPDLYLRTSPKGQIIMRFFDHPTTSYNWKLVSDLRKSASTPEQYDKFLIHTLSLITDDPNEIHQDEDTAWIDFERSISALSGLMTYQPAFEAYLEHVLNRLIDDNVSYIEIRCAKFDVYGKNGTLISYDRQMEAIQKIIDKVVAKNNKIFYGLRFIFSPHKRATDDVMCDHITLVQNLTKRYPNLVIGFDLVGQEKLGRPFKDFTKQFLDLIDDQIPLFLHAGELDWNDTDGHDNLCDALLLGSKRIGHGYILPKYPTIETRIKESNIAVEVCAIANQMLRLITDMNLHPASQLLSKNLAIVISSDSPLTWDTLPLSHDFYVAFMSFGGRNADLKFLKKLIMNSILYSGLKPIEMESLMNLWLQNWNEFIHSCLT